MSFTDLPNELFLHIFTYTESDGDLYALSRLSRALHYTALPIYISHLLGCDAESLTTGEIPRVSVSYKLSAPTSPTPLLRAIRAALFITSIQKFKVVFSVHEQVSFVHTQFRMVLSVIQKLNNIQQIIFEFPSGEPYPDQAIHWTADDHEHIQRLMVQMMTALNNCNCAAVDLFRPDFLESRQLSVTSTPKTLGGSSKLITRSAQLIPRFRRARSSESGGEPVTLLKHLVSLLSDSTVTSLSLDSTDTRLNSPQIRNILPSISLPNILSFSTSSCGLTFNDLVRFLVGHPGLRKLRFRSVDVGDVSPLSLTVARDFLPELTTLDAPESFIPYFIHSRMALPRLERLCVRTHRRLIDPYRERYAPVVLQEICTELDPVLSHLKAREQPVELSLDLEVNLWGPLWGNDPQRTIPHYLPSITTMKIFILQWAWSSKMTSPQHFTGLRNLRKVVIVCGGKIDEDWDGADGMVFREKLKGFCPCLQDFIVLKRTSEEVIAMHDVMAYGR